MSNYVAVQAAMLNVQPMPFNVLFLQRNEGSHTQWGTCQQSFMYLKDKDVPIHMKRPF